MTRTLLRPRKLFHLPGPCAWRSPRHVNETRQSVCLSVGDVTRHELAALSSRPAATMFSAARSTWPGHSFNSSPLSNTKKVALCINELFDDWNSIATTRSLSHTMPTGPVEPVLFQLACQSREMSGSPQALGLPMRCHNLRSPKGEASDRVKSRHSDFFWTPYTVLRGVYRFI